MSIPFSTATLGLLLAGDGEVKHASSKAFPERTTHHKENLKEIRIHAPPVSQYYESNIQVTCTCVCTGGM